MVKRRHVLGALASTAVTACAGIATSTAATPPAANDPDRIDVGGSALVVRSRGLDPLPRAMLHEWTRGAAQMIATYYGGTFPVPGLEITLQATTGDRVGFGQHQDGRWIRIRYGRGCTAETFANDWVMVHEMLHATFPDLSDDHRWMQEGLSTYLEPIVRARAGATAEHDVWRRWTNSMHHGRPKPGDGGLDETHTWGRLYWGGTLFWFVADVRVRELTDNRRSIRDIVTHIAEQGGNGRASWSTARVVAQADAATDTTVVSALYDAMAKAPGDIDLPALLSRLGVVGEGEAVRFDPAAPLAAIRSAITSA